jgi:hypothetical protein
MNTSTAPGPAPGLGYTWGVQLRVDTSTAPQSPDYLVVPLGAQIQTTWGVRLRVDTSTAPQPLATLWYP